MDRGTLYNLALAYIGEGANVPGTSVNEYLKSIDHHCVMMALEYQNWTFATRCCELVVKDGKAALPSDCLRMVSTTLPSFSLRQDGLSAPDCDGTYELLYISRAMADGLELPDNQPAFCEGVALLMASKVAFRATSNYELANTLEQKAYQQLVQAKLKDARQCASNDQKPSNHHPIYD